MDRRSFLRRVGLVAAATGLPPQFLLKPSIANAGALDAQATFLLLSVSSDGDPLNANLPGSYVPDAMNNPLLPATEVSVGSQRWLAGSPWADASLDRFRSRTCFFHHVCHTAAHTEMAAVLGLHGAVASANGRGFEQLPSMIAQENAAALGTLQQEPIALGRDRLTFGSRPLPSIRPQEVAALFLGSPAGGQAASLESLAELRDAAINDLYRSEDFDDDKQIKKVKLERKKELTKARDYFNKLKEQYKVPLESREAFVPQEEKEAYESYKQYKQAATSEQEEQTKRSQYFADKTTQLFSDKFEGFKFAIDENKAVTYKPAEAKSLLEEQSSLKNFVNKFLNEEGYLKDAELFHRAIAIASNPDKFAKFFYEKGMADTVDTVSKESKNIDMVRQSTQVTNKTEGTFQVRAVEPSYGNRLVIKQKPKN
jgi:hypothetical protein